MAGQARPAPWLETLRLALREFVPEDIDDLHRLDSDPRVMRYAGGIKTREQSETMLQSINYVLRDDTMHRKQPKQRDKCRFHGKRK